MIKNAKFKYGAALVTLASALIFVVALTMMRLRRQRQARQHHTKALVQHMAQQKMLTGL